MRCHDLVTMAQTVFKMAKDIQELVPETLREVVEVVPRGFAKSAVIGGILLGAVGGAMITTVAPAWIVAAVPAVLLVVQRFWVKKKRQGV